MYKLEVILDIMLFFVFCKYVELWVVVVIRSELISMKIS